MTEISIVRHVFTSGRVLRCLLLLCLGMLLSACASSSAIENSPPDKLLATDWRWHGAKLADGHTVEPFTSTTFHPSIRFTVEPAPNEGEIGFVFTGNMGCNGMGGTYAADASGRFEIYGVGSTQMLCEDERMAGDLLWTELAPRLNRLEFEGDEMHLMTSDGDVFLFLPEGEVSAENDIYAAIINDWLGNDDAYLIVSDSSFNQAGVSEAETRQQINSLFPKRDEIEGISAELLDSFFANQSDTLDLALPNGDASFITQTELDTIFADSSGQGWQTLTERYPDLQLIFTFSNIGYSDSEALVYYAIHTPNQQAGYYARHFAGPFGFDGGNETSLIWSAAQE